jgi:predicted porin
MLAATNAALAQSSVTLFGLLDVSLTHGSASGTGSSSLTQMASGSYQPSRIGFRGKEDLGGGLEASFWLEAALQPDDGRAGNALTANNQIVIKPNGLNFGRRSTVSLAGSWGEVRFGRDVTPNFWNMQIYSPFGTVGVGGNIMAVSGASLSLGANPAVYGLVPAGTSAAGPYGRASNMFSYFSPANWGPFHLQASYWLGENLHTGAANDRDGTGGGIRASYASGPIDVAVAWTNTTYKGTPVAATAGAPSGDFQSWSIGSKWKFRWATLIGLVGRDTRKSAPAAEGRGWLLGVEIPAGPGEFRASLDHYMIDAGPATADPRATKLAIGYIYNFSKRTALYATVASVQNHDGARLALGGSSFGGGLSGGHSTGLDLGIRHRF